MGRRPPVVQRRSGLQQFFAILRKHKALRNDPVQRLRVLLQIIGLAAVALGQFVLGKLLPAANVSAGRSDGSRHHRRHRWRNGTAHRNFNVGKADSPEGLSIFIDQGNREAHAGQGIKVGRSGRRGIEHEQRGRRQAGNLARGGNIEFVLQFEGGSARRYALC